MKKKSIILSVVIGILLGIIVIRPIWKSIHALDNDHGDTSWLDFMKTSFVEVFSLEHLDETLWSAVFGIALSVLVFMIKARRVKRKGEPL